MSEVQSWARMDRYLASLNYDRDWVRRYVTRNPDEARSGVALAAMQRRENDAVTTRMMEDMVNVMPRVMRAGNLVRVVGPDGESRDAPITIGVDMVAPETLDQTTGLGVRFLREYDVARRTGLVARRRAERLLRETLPDDLYVDLCALGKFEVEGKSGNRYQMAKEAKTIVSVKDGAAVRRYSSCIQLPSECPPGDRVIAEYILVRSDEPAYLRTANLTEIYDPLAGRPAPGDNPRLSTNENRDILNVFMREFESAVGLNALISMTRGDDGGYSVQHHWVRIPSDFRSMRHDACHAVISDCARSMARLITQRSDRVVGFVYQDVTGVGDVSQHNQESRFAAVLLNGVDPMTRARVVEFAVATRELVA